MTLLHRTRRLALVGASLAIAAFVVAPAIASEVGVSIVDRTFTPASMTVAQGDTVTWTVSKSINEPHSVTSGKPGDAEKGKLFDSGIANLQKNGETFKHTFDAAGTFEYFCSVHGAAMSGTVIVLAPGQSAPAAEPPASEGGGPISTQTKATAAGILAIAIVLMFVMAWVWRRMNPA